VLWYSNHLTIRNNTIETGRYGLHFMYCHDALVTGSSGACWFRTGLSVPEIYQHAPAPTANRHGPLKRAKRSSERRGWSSP
jgi:hypothetical protein